jgi:tetratricopeptide (TPR) repeat protein/O-antigen ligase
MPQKAYLWILRIGAILSFVCVFFVFRGLLFPYITSKQIPFNILTEILLVFWAAFIVKYPQWNPFKGYLQSWPFKIFFNKKKNENSAENNSAAEIGKKVPANLVTFGLIAFFIVILISCFTGIDFHMSFWSNAERMLGVYHILHFFILYLVLITVMRDRRDWTMTLTALLVVAVNVAAGSMGKEGQAYSTLGNTLYASVFMIFAFFIMLILFFHKNEGGRGNYGSFVRWFYLLALPFLFWQFRRADNTGAYVGMGAGFISFLFLFGVTSAKRVLRILSWIVAAVIFLGLLLVFTNHNNPFITNNKILGQMNFQKNTFQTRLLSWESAAKDFHNHWLIGTGFGNYSVIFDKYFSAEFFKYSRTETYFDRAHDNLIDIASTSGILGLLAYLSIFAGVGVYLIKALRRRRISPLEFCLLSSLFVAYFVQNLTVFDSFVSYLCLMVVLGYVNWLANTDEERGNERALLAVGGPSGFSDKEIYALLASGIVAVFLIYNYAILPLGMLNRVIQGQIAFSQGDLLTSTALYKDALSHNTPIDKDGRSMFLRSIGDAGWSIGKLSEAQAEDIIEFAVSMGQKNLAYNPNDSLMNMEMARVYNAGFIAVKDQTKKAEYAKQSLIYIDRSIAASPQRIPVYFIKAQFLISQNKIDQAIATLEYASSLSAEYFETSCQLSQVYLIKQNIMETTKASSSAQTVGDKGWEAMDKCLANNGADNLMVEDVVKEAVNHYIKKNDPDKVVLLYEQLVQFEPKNSQFWATLAKLYAQVGKIEEAKKAALEAAAINPGLKADVDEFIKQLDNQ